MFFYSLRTKKYYDIFLSMLRQRINTHIEEEYRDIDDYYCVKISHKNADDERYITGFFRALEKCENNQKN